MGIHEVTRSEFAAFVQASHYQQEGNDCLLTDVSSDPSLIKQDIYAYSQAVRNSNWQYPPWPTSAQEPVTCVNWDDARAYSQWLSQRTGHRYRLPSEAEWEYAARAGTRGFWYWGNSEADACQYENVADMSFLRQRMRSPSLDNHFDCEDGFAWNAPVGSFKPNPWGLYDMVGNASELTQDCWHSSYEGAPTDGSAWLAGGDCRYRVLRGDNGMLNLAWTHLAARSGVPVQQYRSTLGGFRVVRELP
jgi:formylglycine-generating enzyme required for sulfatase activity